MKLSLYFADSREVFFSLFSIPYLSSLSTQEHYTSANQMKKLLCEFVNSILTDLDAGMYNLLIGVNVCTLISIRAISKRVYELNSKMHHIFCLSWKNTSVVWFVCFFSSFTQAIFDQYCAQIDVFLIVQKRKWNRSGIKNPLFTSLT